MIAVLTGDLVNSTKMSNKIYTQVITDLKGLLVDAHNKYHAVGEIYRGDEFQIQFPEPIHAIKCTLLIKLALHLLRVSDKPIQCTLSLAYGSHDILADKPNTSSGPVFVNSGRGLDKTPRGDMSVSVQQDNDNNELKLLTQFLNHLLNRLTRSQAELLYQYIENDFIEHQKMAELTKTSRQNISNRLANIGAFLVKDYIDIINNKVNELMTGEH
ncbi:MarR family transcriptional regulator [Thalassotalea piscium]